MSCKKISDLEALRTLENIVHPGKTHGRLDRKMVWSAKNIKNEANDSRCPKVEWF